MIKQIITFLFNLDRSIKKLIVIFSDILIVIFSFIISMKLRLDSFYFISLESFYISIILIVPICIFTNLYFGLYIPVIRFISGQIIRTIFKCSISISLILFLLSQFSYLSIPRTVPFIHFIVSFLMLGGLRVLIKLIYLNINKSNRKNVAIYGTDTKGRQLLSYLYQSTSYNPVLFFDKDPSVIGSEINGLKVLSLDKNHSLFNELNIDTLFVTTKITSEKIKDLMVKKLDSYPLKIKKILNFSDNSSQFQELTIEDLLDRKTIKPNVDLMKKNINNKIVLISGAGGSIGSEICSQILIFSPKKIILFDHSEYSLYQIYEKLKLLSKEKRVHSDLLPILGSIQNKITLKKIFIENKIDVVFHAAAYKHVNMVEKNIFEAINNNVIGTKNISSLSYNYKIKNFILISSDKAVRSTNIMGASKRVSELICKSYPVKSNSTKFSIVRFGNVMGSSGSVIPKFDKQICSGGPVTVSNINVTRYFMTIKEAAELVIQSVSFMKGRDIFILDMGDPIKIVNLAKKMINLKGLTPIIEEKESCFFKKDDSRVIKIIFTGLNKGEKLYEELMFDNNPKKTDHPRIYNTSEKQMSNKDFSNLISNIEKHTLNKNIKGLKDVLKHPFIQHGKK